MILKPGNQTNSSESSSIDESVIWVPYLSIVCLLLVLIALAFSFYAHMARVKRRRDNARDYIDKFIDLNRKRLFGMMRKAISAQIDCLRINNAIEPGGGNWPQRNADLSSHCQSFRDRNTPKKSRCPCQSFSNNLDSLGNFHTIDNNMNWDCKVRSMQNCCFHVVDCCKKEGIHPTHVPYCTGFVPIHCCHCSCHVRKDSITKVKRSKQNRKENIDYDCHCDAGVWRDSAPVKCHSYQRYEDEGGKTTQGKKKVLRQSQLLPTEIEGPTSNFPIQYVQEKQKWMQPIHIKHDPISLEGSKGRVSFARDDNSIAKSSSTKLQHRRTNSESGLSRSRRGQDYDVTEAHDNDSSDESQSQSPQNSAGIFPPGIRSGGVSHQANSQTQKDNNDNIPCTGDISPQTNVFPNPNETSSITSKVEISSILHFSDYNLRPDFNEGNDSISNAQKMKFPRKKGEINPNFCPEPSDPLDPDPRRTHDIFKLPRGNSTDKPLLEYDGNKDDSIAQTNQHFVKKKRVKKKLNLFKNKKSKAMLSESRTSFRLEDTMMDVGHNTWNDYDSSFDLVWSPDVARTQESSMLGMKASGLNEKDQNMSSLDQEVESDVVV